MARFLKQLFCFEPKDIQILTDDTKQPANLPTRENIRAAMDLLVKGAQPGDLLFFYFSGHATQVKDGNKDEPDGFDESICAMDYMDNPRSPSSPTTPGTIANHDMHDVMVKPLPRGCRLTAVLDCCNSGTLLDLPFKYDSQGVPKMRRTIADVHQKSSEADVVCLSACKDNGSAFEAHEGCGLGRALISCMTSWGNRGTYLDIIRNICTYMGTKDLRGELQFSSSRPIDTNQQFHLLQPWIIS
ncbi:caspase domain-containing protein [Lactarius indigo]|nr:caspase domain-containing protein [Lactarius indigo]